MTGEGKLEENRHGLAVGQRIWIEVEVFEIDGAGDAWVERPTARFHPMRILPGDRFRPSSERPSVVGEATDHLDVLRRIRGNLTGRVAHAAREERRALDWAIAALSAPGGETRQSLAEEAKR